MTLAVTMNQPYPEMHPWFDLRPYLDPSWGMTSSAWHFRALVEGNTAELHLRTRWGTNPVLVEAATLPPEVLPVGQLLIPTYEQSRGSVRLFFEPNGELYLAAGDADVADGSSVNLMFQLRYQRRMP